MVWTLPRDLLRCWCRYRQVKVGSCYVSVYLLFTSGNKINAGLWPAVKHKPLKRPRVYCRCYMIVRVISANNDNELAISWQVSNYWQTILIINHLSTHEQHKGINQKLINNQIKLKLHVCFYETKLGKHYAFSFITIKII